MRQFYTFSPAELSESTAVLNNPCQGLYRIVRYVLTEEGQTADAVMEYDLPLVLLEINLRFYRTCSISTAALTQLDEILNNWSHSGAGLILRFLYDWEGIAQITEPESLNTVLTHMDQVSETINCYASSVYLMQGIFIGNWGEMHGSRFSDSASIQTLALHLHEVVTPSIYLSVRTPAQWRMITGLDKGTFGDQSPIAGRLGLFNDGMLGSRSDLGTYEDLPSLSGKGTREKELAFQNHLCQSVPNGGEVVHNTPYNDLPAAVCYLSTIHASYLNADYDPVVLKKWRKTLWKGKGAFHGCDGLHYIQTHLGYRYTVRRFSLRKTGLLRPKLALRINLENTGFGNALKPLDAAFSLRNATGEEIFRLPLPFDFRNLRSGEKQKLTASLPEKDLPKGSCQLFFSVTEPATGRQIALANTAYEQDRGLLLGQLVI